MNNILQINNLCKSFLQGKSKLEILKNINLSLLEGEIIALFANSGSGKTTLLQIIGLLDNPDSGEIIINGTNILKSNEKVKNNIRKNNIGFIYQFHHLLNDFTAIENVMMPEFIKSTDQKSARMKALDILEKVGLSNRINHYPSELSGGEQQRVAIARALVSSPYLLLADEPTGNLDYENSKSVIDLFIKIVKDLNISAIIVTHNIEIANQTDKIITIDDKTLKNYIK